jgi:hypothetical protein
MINLLNPDLTPLDAVEITHFEAGQDSDPIPFCIQNTGPDQTDLLLVIQAENPSTGLTVSSGIPPLDELWARVRLTGQTGTAAAQAPELTDWLPLGTTRALPIKTLLQGGIHTAEIRFHPPSTAATLAWRFTLGVIAAENSYPVGPGARQGILTGLGDHGHSALLKGFQPTATTPPSDTLHIAAGHVIYRGRLIGHVGADIPLDQQDAAGAPLEPGQLYQALLTAGPNGYTLTKGLKGTTPTAPAPPPWEPPIALLTIHHQPTITEIAPADIEDRRLFDRYQAEPGTGLHLRLHPGQAIAGGTLRTHSTLTNLLLPPNATTYLWQRASGAWDLGTPTPPETTALGPLWLITTDADSITNLQDRRTYATDTVVLHLRGPVPATPGPIVDLLVAHDGLILEDVIYRLSDNGGGTSGQTKLDLLLDGATLYPSSALDDQRPAWPFDAADLIQQGRIHEVTELWPGKVIQLTSIEYPTGGTPAWAEAYLLCRKS